MNGYTFDVAHFFEENMAENMEWSEKVVSIPMNVFRFWQNLVFQEKNEVAGAMLYDDEKKIAIIDETRLTGGTSNSVSPQFAPFSFHTHPLASYAQITSPIAWPSSADFSIITQSFMNLDLTSMDVHFVASVEGLWVIQVTNAFQKVIQMATENGRVSALISAWKKIKDEGSIRDTYLPVTFLDPVDAADLFLRVMKQVTIRSVFFPSDVEKEDVCDMECDTEGGDTKECDISYLADERCFDVKLIDWQTVENEKSLFINVCLT